MTTTEVSEATTRTPAVVLAHDDHETPYHRVLLIEDDSDDATLVRKALISPHSGFQMHVEQTLLCGQLRIDLYLPHVILLDLTLPDSTGFDSFSAIHRMAPDIPVVVLSGMGSEALATRIVRAGAEDYLVKGSFDQRTLTRVLRHAIERHARSRAGTVEVGKVVGFLGATGGAGTTTVAVNVAVALAQLGVKATHVELSDTGISAAFQLGEAQLLGEPRSKLASDRINTSLVESKLYRQSSGARFLFRAQVSEEMDELEPERVERLIQATAQGAALTILDLPSHLSRAVKTAARWCDLMIVVVDRDPSSVNSAGLALDRLRSWGLESRQLAALIVNRSGLATPPPISEITTQLGCEILGVVPPSADNCALAAKRHMPLVLSEPDSLAAGALLNLASRLKRL